MQEQENTTTHLCGERAPNKLSWLLAVTVLNLATKIDAIGDSKWEIVDYFPSLFQGLENLGMEFESNLKPKATPHSLFAPSHVPIHLH